MRRMSDSPIISFGKNFCKCGLIGWCMECFWTGLISLENVRKDRRLLCQTSLWMFPIYGLAAFLPAIYQTIRRKCALFRASIYSGTIFLFEFLTGSLLRKLNACPWDYTKSKHHYKGLICPDYAPLWALAGLLFEHLTCKKTSVRS